MFISVDQAVQVLKNKGVVAVPTETVYGLAGNGLAAEAIQKIYKAKGRPSNNPVILHFLNIEQTRDYVESWPQPLLELVGIFSPGPITFLVPKSTKVPNEVTAGNELVAIRFPNHPLTRELLSKLDFPLAAPSANISGYISPTRPEVVQAQIGNRIDGIIDGGQCHGGIESTIVAWEEGKYCLYREGLVTAEMIESATGHEIEKKVSKQHLVAPGMMSSHYAPKTKTILVSDIVKSIEAFTSSKVGVITLSKMDRLKVSQQFALSDSGNLEEIASNLYQTMYDMDQAGVDVILIEKAPNHDIGAALNDRLNRAVAPK